MVRFTDKCSAFAHLPSATLLLQTGPAFSLCHSRPSPRSWSKPVLPYSCVALVCHYLRSVKSGRSLIDVNTWIYLPQRDGRLSCPSWLTHSGQFTYKVVTRQPLIGRKAGKVCQPKTNILTTEPRRHLVPC